MEPLECIDSHDVCRGPVNWHSVDPGRAAAVPRCEKHWQERLARRDNSIEVYEYVTEAPGWFDPGYAGEQW